VGGAFAGFTDENLKARRYGSASRERCSLEGLPSVSTISDAGGGASFGGGRAGTQLVDFAGERYAGLHNGAAVEMALHLVVEFKRLVRRSGEAETDDKKGPRHFSLP